MSEKESKVIIRLATEQDAAAIAELQQQWCDEDITWGYYADTPEGIKGYLGNHSYVAELDGCIIGFVLGRIGSAIIAALPDNEPSLEIVDLYVVPEYRSHGIGGLLLERLLHDAKNAGITNFRLFSGTKDTARTVAFYQRHGFKVVGVDMVRTED